MARATPAFEQILDELSREHGLKWRFEDGLYRMEKPLAGTQLVLGLHLERGIDVSLATDPGERLYEQAPQLPTGASSTEREEELLSDLDALLQEFASSELRIDPASAKLQIRSGGDWRPFFENAPIGQLGDS